MQILKSIFVVFEVLMLFNLLIFVHELGHFLAAKWRGMKVERFAIWFGKPIWKKTIGGVEYALGSIPAGGYVSLPQMAPMEIIEGKTDSTAAALPTVSALDKIIVAVAGPLFSFLLAVFFAVIVWGVGRPMDEADKTTTIGWVDSTGPAAKAGLQPGDKILEVDGHPVTQFMSGSSDSVVWRVVTSEGSTIEIKYLRDGKEAVVHAVPFHKQTAWYERKAMRQLQIAPADDVMISDLATNGPAKEAGLKEGDRVVALNGKKIYHFQAIVDAQSSATNAPPKAEIFTVERGTNQFNYSVMAVKPLRPADAKPSFGILGLQGSSNIVIMHPTPASQIEASFAQITGTIRALFSRKSEIGVQQLGGAILIIRVYKNMFENENGWRMVLWFSVIMNVNLALLNMLPFPVLDGGHITLALLELVRRRPVSAIVLQYLQTACAVALIGLMLFLAFFDSVDWARSSGKTHDEPIVFAPKK